MRWPLRYQILLPFAAVMLLVLLGASVLNAYLAAARSERQIAAQLRDIAATLRDASFPLPDPVLKQLRSLSGAEFVLMADDGAVLAASDKSFIGQHHGLSRDESNSTGLGQSVEVHGTRYFHTALPVAARGSRGEPAMIHILYPERIWREARWQAAWPPLAVGAVALALVAILAIAMAARLSRPILQLRTQLGRLATGDFQPLPLPERNDELRDLVGSVNSLAAQLRELELAIQRSERLALLGQLSGGLVHHLRNDVAGARMAVQLHQRHCRDTDQDSMAVALRQLSLTEEHLQRFLTAGAPQAPCRVPFDLRTILDDLAVLLRPTCRHRKVDLRVGSSEQPVILNADPDQIRQLLLNLVLNAIDAAGHSGWVKIEVDDDRQGSIHVRVFDSGVGPPEPLREKLFEPFVTGKPEGIGLGLAVARQIAGMHGGSVYFTREQATCFELVLPTTAECAHIAAPTSQPADRENHGAMKK